MECRSDFGYVVHDIFETHNPRTFNQLKQAFVKVFADSSRQFKKLRSDHLQDPSNEELKILAEAADRRRAFLATTLVRLVTDEKVIAIARTALKDHLQNQPEPAPQKLSRWASFASFSPD